MDDFLVKNNLPKSFLSITNKWTNACYGNQTKKEAIWEFLSSINQTELFYISKWMVENGYGHPKFKESSERLISDMDNEIIDHFNRSQTRNLMLFISVDLDKLP